MSQLALPLELPIHATFDTFYALERNTWIAYLQDFAKGVGERCLYLEGEARTGCTHLLQAICYAAHEVGRRSAYIPCREATGWDPSFLEGLEACDLLVFDDVDVVAGHQAFEEALFHIYNRAERTGTQLVFSAHHKPADIAFHLPDLKSRLQAILCISIPPLTETGKLHLMQSYAEARGLVLPEEVAQFLLHRVPRDLRYLLDILDQLDRASLETHRRLTIPFVKSLPLKQLDSRLRGND